MLSVIWDYVSSRGVSSFGKKERTLIELYNQMAFLSVIAISIVSTTSLLLDFPIEYAIITFGLIFFYSSIIILNHFGQVYTVRFIVAILSPLWICVAHLLIGGNFSQGLLIITGLIITYVSFDRRPVYRLYLMSFGVIIYLGALVLSQYYEPYFGVIDSPYDDFLAFFMASGWIGKVIFAFIKDREKLIQSLQSNNTKLKETTEELERFTYIASHDLKSPLRTINSFIGLIERDIKKEKYDALPERMEFVKSGAKQMNTLVEDILEISILNNPSKKKKIPIDLNDLVEKVYANLKEDIRAKNAFLTIEKLPFYTCDEAEFMLLFQNMIQNGIKYNESPSPQIKISSQEVNNQLIISFKDNGIGVEEEYHEQIFQFFKRLHTSDKYNGTGLGLGLCKKIVSSYNGDIKVISELGKGSTFQIILSLDTTNN